MDTLDTIIANDSVGALAHDLGVFLNRYRAHLPQDAMAESYALHVRANRVADAARKPIRPEAVDTPAAGDRFIAGYDLARRHSQPQAAAAPVDGMVLVPREKLRDWELRARREVRSGHRCDAVTFCDAIQQATHALLAAPTREAASEHADDVAVDRFAAALKAKLAEARAKGRGGWEDDEPDMQQRLSDMLRDHVAKGDPRDVGNFAMFLHQRGEAILPAKQPEAAHGEQGVVGSLTVRRFRGVDAMVNHEFDYFGNLPDGRYSLYTGQPEAVAAGRIRSELFGNSEGFVQDALPAMPEPLKQVAVAGYHDGVLKEPLEDYYSADQMRQARDTWFAWTQVLAAAQDVAPEEFSPKVTGTNVDRILRVIRRQPAAAPGAVDVSRLLEAVGEYWDAAWKEGRENRKHDTEDGRGQRLWHEIETGIHSLSENAAALAALEAP